MAPSLRPLPLPALLPLTPPHPSPLPTQVTQKDVEMMLGVLAPTRASEEAVCRRVKDSIACSSESEELVRAPNTDPNTQPNTQPNTETCSSSERLRLHSACPQPPR